MALLSIPGEPEVEKKKYHKRGGKITLNIQTILLLA